MYTEVMDLEDKVCNHIILQEQAFKQQDVFGVEVELEGKNIYPLPAAIQAMWANRQEGSLRKLKDGDQTAEYVFRQPFDLRNAEKAIDTLFSYLMSKGIQVYESYRTSIHVHVNCAHETYRTIYNFMTICLILDELLVSQNGEHRIGNNFCLRAKDAMGQVIALIQSIQMQGNFFAIQGNNRYSSINFASLTKFGSIEFRSLECTMHQGRLLHWIGTLQRMKEIARTFKNPVEIIRKFSQTQPQEFLSEILGPYAIKYLFVPDMEIMLFNGMRIAQDFAYCSEWKEKGE